MAKTNQIKKVVNGEIADADDINQIVENAGSEGGSIPYEPILHERATDGSQSLGNIAYPWGHFCISEDAELKEIVTASHTVGNSVAIKNLRRFITLKDSPGNGAGSYTGNAGKFVRVKADVSGLEFSEPVTSQMFTSNGTFTVPDGITKVYLTMVGGGGGGGGSVDNQGGGGGGGGGYIIHFPYTVTPGASIAVVVGQGGAGGADNGGDGENGTASTFNTVISCAGGSGGEGNDSIKDGTGGVGGGLASFDATTTTPSSYVQKGGNGGDGGTNSSSGGAGGSTPFGTGAVGGNGSPGLSGTDGTGAGGAGGSDTSGTIIGGAGGNGFVLIQY